MHLLWNNPFLHYKYVLFSLANKKLTGRKLGRKYRQNSQTQRTLVRKRAESEGMPASQPAEIKQDVEKMR